MDPLPLHVMTHLARRRHEGKAAQAFPHRIIDPIRIGGEEVAQAMILREVGDGEGHCVDHRIEPADQHLDAGVDRFLVGQGAPVDLTLEQFADEVAAVAATTLGDHRHEIVDEQLLDLGIGHRPVGPGKLIGEVLQLGQVRDRQADDLHEDPDGQLLGEVMDEIATAIGLEPLDQFDRQVDDALLGPGQRLGRQIVVQQFAERAMGRRVERQRDQLIGLARGGLGNEHDAAGKTIRVRHHQVRQVGAKRDPVPAIVRRPHHRIGRGDQQLAPVLMKIAAVGQWAVDVEIEHPVFWDIGRTRGNHVVGNRGGLNFHGQALQLAGRR